MNIFGALRFCEYFFFFFFFFFFFWGGGVYLGAISKHFRVIIKVNVQNGE